MVRHSIRKEDVRFVVNEEKRTVVCYLEGTKRLFIDFANDNMDFFPICYEEGVYDKLLLPNRFVGKSYCSPNDKWDEEKGKLLAYHRMKNDLNRDFRQAARIWVDYTNRQVEQASRTVSAYINKLNANSSRRQQVVADMFNEEE